MRWNVQRRCRRPDECDAGRPRGQRIQDKFPHMYDVVDTSVPGKDGFPTVESYDSRVGAYWGMVLMHTVDIKDRLKRSLFSRQVAEAAVAATVEVVASGQDAAELALVPDRVEVLTTATVPAEEPARQIAA